MAGSTKERLTGALILVAALVVLVPEMLSGPGGGRATTAPAQDPAAGPPMRTYDLALDPAARDGKPRQVPEPSPVQEAAAVPPPVTQPAPPPPVAETQPAAPVPAPQEGGAPADSATPGTQPPAVAKAPRPATAEPKGAPATGKWWVQAGVFASADNAQRLARELKAAGIPVAVSQITVQGKPMHRVRAGPVADRAAALALQARLAAKGHKSSLIAP